MKDNISNAKGILFPKDRYCIALATALYNYVHESPVDGELNTSLCDVICDDRFVMRNKGSLNQP
jgi:hypothetical protein